MHFQSQTSQKEFWGFSIPCSHSMARAWPQSFAHPHHWNGLCRVSDATIYDGGQTDLEDSQRGHHSTTFPCSILKLYIHYRGALFHFFVVSLCCTHQIWIVLHPPIQRNIGFSSPWTRCKNCNKVLQVQNILQASTKWKVGNGQKTCGGPLYINCRHESISEYEKNDGHSSKNWMIKTKTIMVVST